VIDPSGGVLPGVALTLTDVELGIRFSAVSDRTGSFLFRDLQPGRYELVARLAGFATVTSVFRFDAGTQTERRLTLPLGSLQETLTMVCAPGAAVLPTADRRAFAFSGRVAPAAASLFTRPAPTTPGLAAQDAATAPRPVRVGGQIRAPRQLKKVNPVCPRTVLPSDDTVVVLVGTIGVDGYMYEVQPAEPKPAAAIPPSEFVESALEAVRQWQYSPTLLNNVAVPVQVTVTILYRRG
jgi:hypothetical protein